MGAVTTEPSYNQWSSNAQTTTGVACSLTRAAVPGVTHVLETICAMADNTANTARTMVVRDGPSGTGAIIWQVLVGSGSTAGAVPLPMSGLRIKGTKGNALTVEFTSGPTNNQTLSVTGYDI